MCAPAPRLARRSVDRAPTPLPALHALCVRRRRIARARADSPAALLVLASSLGTETTPSDARDGGGRATVGLREVGLVGAVRFVLLPLASLGALTAVRTRGWLPPDPLLDFMLVLQSAMPSAQNSVIALQVRGESARASRMARVLLLVYLMAILPVAVILTAALQRSSLALP
jgi:predicted permease